MGACLNVIHGFITQLVPPPVAPHQHVEFIFHT